MWMCRKDVFMQILFITHYYAPDSGAAANRLTRLATMLAQRGHEVTVLTNMPHYPKGKITEGYEGKFTVVEERDGVRVVQVWLWATPSPKITRRLISQLSFMITGSLRGLFMNRPNVIFIENQPLFTGLAGWFISKVKRRSYVMNVSDYWPEYLVVAGVVSETSLIYRIFRALTNLTQRDAFAIVALVDPLLVRIKARLGEVNNGIVIKNAVDLDKIRPPQNTDEATAFLKKFDLSPDYKWITFLGVLGNHIDLDTMLKVALSLKDREDVRFLFVGSGTQKNDLVTALKQPDYAHCYHLDWVDSADIPSFWASSYLHFWSLENNELDKLRFQAKLYEALASGTPTVIAGEGLMSDILNENHIGMTVAPYDADALTQTIAQLLDDETLYNTISQNARQYAEKNFDLTQVVDRYEAILQRAVDKGQ